MRSEHMRYMDSGPGVAFGTSSILHILYNNFPPVLVHIHKNSKRMIYSRSSEINHSNYTQTQRYSYICIYFLTAQQ